METEDKFLNQEYIETRMRDFKEIKNKQAGFKVVKSDRPTSRTLYIYFYIQGSKCSTLRISDHNANTPHDEFIVNPDKPLTKKKKELFVRTVENQFRKAHFKFTSFKLRVIGD